MKEPTLGKVIDRLANHPLTLDTFVRGSFGVTSHLLTRLSEAETHRFAPDGTNISWNRSYSLMSDSLKNLIRDSSPTWSSNSERLSPSEILKSLQKPVTSEEARLLFPKINSLIVKEREQAQLQMNTIVGRSLIDVARQRQINLDMLIKIVVGRLPQSETITKAWRYHGESEYPDPEKVAKDLEKIASDKGTLLNRTDLLKYFLKTNSNDLNAAINAAAFFLRSWTRPMAKKDQDYEALELERAQWMQKFILDENSQFQPYNHIEQVTHSGPSHPKTKSLFEKIITKLTNRSVPDFDPRYHLVNQVGLPYHQFFLVSLLQTLTPEAIMLLTAVEHLKYGEAHGSNKISADFLMLKDLKQIDRLLNNLNSSL